VTELDWVSDAVPEGLAVLVTLAVAERLGVCVVVGVLDMDCEAVWLCVGVLLGEHTSLRPRTSILLYEDASMKEAGG